MEKDIKELKKKKIVDIESLVNFFIFLSDKQELKYGQLQRADKFEFYSQLKGVFFCVCVHAYKLDVELNCIQLWLGPGI